MLYHGQFFLCTLINFAIFVNTNTVSQCQQTTFSRPYHFSISLPGTFYMHISTVQGSVPYCASECARDPKCSSVLHNSRIQMCMLLHCPLSPADIIQDTSGNGWDYFVSETECSEGWFRFEDHCYYHNLTISTWSEAENVCNHHGAHLVEINSMNENLWLDRELTDVLMPHDSDEKKSWIGATDVVIEGQWLWSFSNTTLEYQNWRQGEPNNVHGKEHCAAMLHDGRWNDQKCSIERAFICEKILL